MKERIKIGFYCSSISWGGLEMNLLRHAVWMIERGWNVTLFCVENTRIHEYATSERMTVELVERNKKYFDFKLAKRLATRLDELQIELLWIRDGRDISTVGLAKKKSKREIKILYQQAMQIGVNKKDVFHTVRYKRIDLWVSPLRFLANQVKEKTNFPTERIAVIPLGIDCDKYLLKKLDKTESREDLNLPKNRFILGIIGRIDHQKGQLFLVECLIRLRKENIEIDLLMVGDKTEGEAEEYYKEIINTVKNNKVEDHVHIRPFMPETGPFYAAIDCFAMASEGETFGMVTVEAMLFGRAIIGTNTSGTPELLRQGEFGKLYRPGDVVGFCNKLKETIEELKTSGNANEEIQKKTIQDYSHLKICEQLETEIFSLFE